MNREQSGSYSAMGRQFGCVVSNNVPKEFVGACWAHGFSDNLPILYIGYDNASQSIEGFDVTKKKYDGDIWWCFGRREKRKDYITTVSDFKEYCIKRAVGEIRYEYVDFTCYDMERVKSFIRYMKGVDRKICFITRGSEFMFIYSERYNVVWGLSLSLCDYVGIDRKKVISQIKENRKNVFVGSTAFIDADMRKIIGNDTHIIPILYNYFC